MPLWKKVNGTRLESLFHEVKDFVYGTKWRIVKIAKQWHYDVLQRVIARVCKSLQDRHRVISGVLTPFWHRKHAADIDLRASYSKSLDHDVLSVSTTLRVNNALTLRQEENQQHERLWVKYV